TMRMPLMVVAQRCSFNGLGQAEPRARRIGSKTERALAMDLNYTPDDEAFRARTRKWFAEHRPSGEGLEARKAWQRTLYEAGFVGMGWPREYGGQDARPMEQAIVAEEMAMANLPGPINGLALGLLGPTLIVHGSDEQKQRYIKKMLTAEEI